jgi:hypothetical protein
MNRVLPQTKLAQFIFDEVDINKNWAISKKEAIKRFKEMINVTGFSQLADEWLNEVIIFFFWFCRSKHSFHFVVELKNSPTTHTHICVCVVLFWVDVQLIFLTHLYLSFPL